MTHSTNPHRFAGAAIAAVLALGSTPLWAQDIAPVAAPPAPVAAPVAPPAIVLPPVTAAPAAPVVDAPAPEPAVAAPSRERAAPRAAAPATRSAPARPAAAPVARTVSAPVAAAPAEAPVADIAPTEPVATAATPIEEPQVAETATAAPANDSGDNILPIAGLLAALGLGGIGLLATRRRRRVSDEVAPVIIPHEPAPVPTARAESPVPSFAAAPLAAQPVMQQQATQPARTAWQEPRRTAAAPAATRLNREALLDRMVAAEPDANNPFTSGKARRRRARLMLQSMDNNRWDDAELESGFDWREQARATQARESISA